MASDRDLHTMSAGAWLPLAQALISGGMIAVVILAVGFALRWRSVFAVAAVIGALAMVAAWGRFSGHWLKLTRGAAPVVMLAPMATQPAEVVRVEISEVTDAGHLRAREFVDLPASAEQLRELADGIINRGKTFSERTWIGPGRPFTPDGFRSLRAELERRGLIVNLGDRQGFGLSVAGRHVLAGMCSSPSAGSVADYGDAGQYAEQAAAASTR